MPIMCENSKLKLFTVDNIKKIYCEKACIYSSGNIVTYVLNGRTYQEEVDEGESVLSPKTFSPSVSNATFLGWSTSPNSASIVSALVMGDKPITLYGVVRYNNVSIPVTDSSELSFSDQQHSTAPERISTKTVTGSIDCEKYSAVDVTADGSVNWWGSTGSAWASIRCGGGIFGNSDATGWLGWDQNGPINGTYRVNFTQKSGHSSVVTAIHVKGYGGSGKIRVTGVTAYGKTVVG